MALLHTGSPKKCGTQPPRELDFDFGTLDTRSTRFLSELDISNETSSTSSPDIVSLEAGVSLIDQVNGKRLASGDFSVNSPLSDYSTDSGVLSTTVFEEDQFLTGLFGADFSLFQNTPLPCSPPPSSPDQPVASMTVSERTSQCMPQVSCAPEVKNNVEVKPDSISDKSRKNAECARQNRIKKKKYVEDLEKERSKLKTENVVLKTKCHEYFGKMQKLQSEVEYLKNILANESMLSSLIQNIPNTPDVKLSSSFSSRKRPNTESRSALTSKKPKPEVQNCGICLHVVKEKVSLEFCENCSKLASLS